MMFVCKVKVDCPAVRPRPPVERSRELVWIELRLIDFRPAISKREEEIPQCYWGDCMTWRIRDTLFFDVDFEDSTCGNLTGINFTRGECVLQVRTAQHWWRYLQAHFVYIFSTLFHFLGTSDLLDIQETESDISSCETGERCYLWFCSRPPKEATCIQRCKGWYSAWFGKIRWTDWHRTSFGLNWVAMVILESGISINSLASSIIARISLIHPRVQHIRDPAVQDKEYLKDWSDHEIRSSNYRYIILWSNRAAIGSHQHAQRLRKKTEAEKDQLTVGCVEGENEHDAAVY